MTIEVAAKEVADFYQFYNQKLEPMNRDKLADFTELYNPAFTDEQIHFMAEIIDQGFDPREYWVGGKAMNLTEKRLFAEDIADIKYQVQIDSIPRMLFSAEQWHEIEAGITDKLDVTVYAKPEFSPEQMSIKLLKQIDRYWQHYSVKRLMIYITRRVVTNHFFKIVRNQH